MTIKNTCLVITTAFLFYVFVGPLDLGDGCLIISFCVYSIATMIYMVVLGNFPLDAVEAPEKRERIAHYFFEICEKRAIMIFTSMVVVAAVAFTKNIHFPMVVIVNNHEIPEFDLVGVVRFIFVILLFFSPALLCVDIYGQAKLNRKAAAELEQKKHEETAERAIVAVLEQHFMTVYRLDQPVDLLVGFRGVNHLVECKTGHKGYGKGLNSNQTNFAAGWKGSPVVTLHSTDEAIDWASKVAKGL